MKKLRRRMVYLVFVICAPVQAQPPMQAIMDRFTATQDGVELSYQISYHVLGLKLLRIGEARCYSVEGEWINEEGDPVPAFFSAVCFDTDDDPADDKRERISIHNQMVAVMTDPELKTLVYFKHADEFLNPFFKDPRHEYYLDYYAITNGRIDYYREDYDTGERQTDLKDADALVEQSNAIAAILKRMSDIYLGKETGLTQNSDFRVYFNVEGEVKPFAVESFSERMRVDPVDRKMDALRVDISLAPEAEGKAGYLSIWGAPLSSLAAASNDMLLSAVSDQSPDWAMVPLHMKYKRPIGHIRCRLQTIGVNTFAESVNQLWPASE